MQNTEQDRGRFAILMGELAVSFRTEAGSEVMNVYFSKLMNLSMYQIDMAINRIIDQGEKFPTVAEVKKVARTYRAEPLPENRHLPLIELHVPDDAPKTKEDFLKAMAKLTTSMEG